MGEPQGEAGLAEQPSLGGDRVVGLGVDPLEGDDAAGDGVEAGLDRGVASAGEFAEVDVLGETEAVGREFGVEVGERDFAAFGEHESRGLVGGAASGPPGKNRDRFMGDLASLRNLGPKSTAWFAEAGVDSIAELRRLGAVDAFLLVRTVRRDASLNLLWAVAAGLEDRDWRDLTDREKADLRAEVDAATR